MGLKMRSFDYVCLSILSGPGSSDDPELVLSNITWDIH